MTRLHLDYETRSNLDLRVVGVDRYSTDPSTKVLMASFKINDEKTQQWVPAEGECMPSDLKQALHDPEVTKIGFNVQFERWITKKVLGIENPVESWKCSMALAYMFSFVGGLDDIAKQMNLKHKKHEGGVRLIRMFCGPNKPNKTQPFVWRDNLTDPEDWETFKGYNIGDTDADYELWTKLNRFDVPEWRWDMYHIDQIINDRGLPINREFVQNALEIAKRRKTELISEQNRITKLQNSNSNAQFLPWAKDRGYWFDDLQKDTVAKVLAEEEQEVANPSQTYVWAEKKFVTTSFPDAKIDSLGRVNGNAILTDGCRAVLRMRAASSKTSTTKYDACIRGLADDDRLRHCFQFAGASRTNRWAGRKIQPQNLGRTPKWLEPESYINFDRLDYCNQLIQNGCYEALGLFAGEQMDAVAGCVRSCIQASAGKVLVVCDLASIESVCIFWLTDCNKGLDVFNAGKDIYKAFAVDLFHKPYDEINKGERGIAKPGVLGAGYRLSGGELRDGKKTGLWGYAEAMGVHMTCEQAQATVNVFRETYAEIPAAWYAIENAIAKALRNGGRIVKWKKLTFQVKKPFLVVTLPSGRPMYYYKARVEQVDAVSRAGNDYKKDIISYMGKNQITTQWERIESHGGKFIENFVQAIAMDLLACGLYLCHKDGFYIVGHVHDEIISEEDEQDTYHTWQRKRKHMVARPWWAPGIPLDAAGYQARVYRKD